MNRKHKFIIPFCYAFLAGLGSRSEPGVYGSLEPEPLEKKQGAGAGAAWKKSQEPEPVKITRLLSPARR